MPPLICNSLDSYHYFLVSTYQNVFQFYEWPSKSKSSWSCMQFLGKPRSVIFPAMQCIKGNLFLLLSLIIQETFPTKPVGLVCPGLPSQSCPALAVKHYTTGGGKSLSKKVLLRVIFVKKVDIRKLCNRIKSRISVNFSMLFPKFLACASLKNYYVYRKKHGKFPTIPKI